MPLDRTKLITAGVLDSVIEHNKKQFDIFVEAIRTNNKSVKNVPDLEKRINDINTDLTEALKNIDKHTEH